MMVEDSNTNKGGISMILTTVGLDDFYQSLVDILNSILPVGSTITTATAPLNEWLAWLIVVVILYALFVRPLLRLLKVVK
jgi:hypothetical protein